MSELRYIRPRDLLPWPKLNPRQRFDENRMAELVASVREKGVLQPLLVHERLEPSGSITIFEGPWVVAGESRLRAALEAGLETIPCIVGKYTLAEALEIALLENLQRADLTAIEEARGFKRLLEETECTQAELAGKVGKSQPYVANRIRLLDLPDVAIALIEDGIVPPATARDLLLPFARIPEGPRLELFKEFAKWARKVAADDPELRAHEIERGIAPIAAALSRALTEQMYVNGRHDVLPAFDPKLHKSCGCNGPKFKYGWQESVRCFDPIWWDARHAEAVEADHRATKQQEEKLKETGSVTAQRHFVDHDALRKRYGWNDWTGLPHDDLYDPGELVGARFVTYGPNRDIGCLDTDRVGKAKAAASREVKKRLRAKQREIEAKVVAEASATETVDASLLRFLLDRTHDRTDLSATAKLLGIEIDIPTYARTDDLAKIPADRLVPFAKLLQLRHESGAWRSYQNPLESKIAGQVKAGYAAARKALIDAIRAEPVAPPEEKKPGARARRREKAAEVAHV